MRYTCAACSSENEVLPPKGYRLVELENGEDEEEFEDEDSVHVKVPMKGKGDEDEEEDEDEQLDEDERNPFSDTPYDHRPSGSWSDKKDSGVGRVVDDPHAGRAGRSSDPRRASEAVRTFASRYGKLLRETRWFKRSRGKAPVLGLPSPSIDTVTGRRMG